MLPGDARGQSVHVAVLLREVMRALELEPGLTVVDGTIGAAGHGREIAKRIEPGGQLIGLDRDLQMLEIAARSLPSPPAHLVQASYAQLVPVLSRLEIPGADRILLDLGLSSDQLADDSRGFSFHATGELDLRFDTSCGEPAWQLLARIDEQELARILHEYGEELHSHRLAKHLLAWRRKHSLRTARDLAEAIVSAGTSRASHGETRHPATRVFQALRIAVNAELEQLETFLAQTLPACLKPGGIIAIISFHSLEDRLVKNAFRDVNLWQALTPKPVQATIVEQRANPRSRSAKLRAARKI